MFRGTILNLDDLAQLLRNKQSSYKAGIEKSKFIYKTTDSLFVANIWTFLVDFFLVKLNFNLFLFVTKPF